MNNSSNANPSAVAPQVPMTPDTDAAARQIRDGAMPVDSADIYGNSIQNNFQASDKLSEIKA